MTKIIAMLFVFSCVAAAAQAAEKFTLTSESFKNGGKIPEDYAFNQFTCDGKNKSPELKWSGEPKDTKFFAVTAYDPDAPTGSGWWHWVVIDIPANVHELKEGAGNPGGELPAGAVQTRTDFGEPGYGGPCPPKGDKPHHYIFTVWALKDKIGEGKESSGALIGFNINAKKLGSAKLTGLYGRK